MWEKCDVLEAGFVPMFGSSIKPKGQFSSSSLVLKLISPFDLVTVHDQYIMIAHDEGDVALQLKCIMP